MKEKPNLVVMLTYNDVTVKNAHEVFESCKDLNVSHWGFKNIGLPKSEMKKLAEAMKNAGKTTYLEVVTYDEESCMEGAKTAVECGFDQLMGTLYFPSVHQYLMEHDVTYKPFVGKVYGSPSVLEGSFDEIVMDAKKMMQKGITGFDILAYRHEQGEELAKEFCSKVNAEICIAGSISSYERIDTMFEIGPWGFTMGSALFDSKYVQGGGFRDNLSAVIQYMEIK
ncbi:hypothetical protein EAI89_16300 [Eubacterium sp. am_0171]|uniref:hypothetical protein n=1 Tax=unclassified Eubacterium (in: firmicutes) TaxID=2624479 RepID=UPI0010202BD4|nr:MULTISPECIES: hypothetical protein [unclassified Eubacterium (in: firmicutes)]MSC85282.1 hypothetical protein [Eubacterium sp. BIOML-A1]MSD07760.1 hypothetical protein [Eubacterium sp. BIOML-A2]RYT13961.1 hypothetical protein EAI89_16300 [Eubacterium sp. am_0171]